MEKKKEKGEKGKLEDDAALLEFLQQKKKFFDLFDTTCLATTPLK